MDYWKLIELLNEYEQLNMCRKFDCFEMHTFEDSSWVDRLLEDTVISARYWFIKWLVENDKIDFDMPIETLSFREYYDIKKSDFLIALLSIQDEPIRFLCSILK